MFSIADKQMHIGRNIKCGMLIPDLHSEITLASFRPNKRAIYRANDWVSMKSLFFTLSLSSPSLFPARPASSPAALAENWSSTLIESRLNATNSSVGLVPLSPFPSVPEIAAFSFLPLSPRGSLCLCCRGKIHGKAFDLPGDLFVPSDAARVFNS